MHEVGDPGRLFAFDENTTRTIIGGGWIVTFPARGKIVAGGPRRSCSFIAAEDWRYGTGDPFCDAPALPGSSYCERHHALCEIAPASAEGAAAALALSRAADAAAPPPSDLAFLLAPTPPEIDPEAEPQDIAACLDLPSQDHRDREG